MQFLSRVFLRMILFDAHMLLDQLFNALRAKLCEDLVDSVKNLRIALGYADRIGFLGGTRSLTVGAGIVKRRTLKAAVLIDDIGCGKLIDDNDIHLIGLDRISRKLSAVKPRKRSARAKQNAVIAVLLVVLRRIDFPVDVDIARGIPLNADLCRQGLPKGYNRCRRPFRRLSWFQSYR